jgi:hypothetical protein
VLKGALSMTWGVVWRGVRWLDTAFASRPKCQCRSFALEGGARDDTGGSLVMYNPPRLGPSPRSGDRWPWLPLAPAKETT